MGSPLSVGDCLQLAQIVHRVYDACTDGRKGASAEYAELKNEVSAMETALHELETAIANDTFQQRVSGSGERSSEERISEMIENCRITLDKVIRTLKKYTELDSEDSDDDVGRVKKDRMVGGASATEKSSLFRLSSWASWPRPGNFGSKPSTLQKSSTTTTDLSNEGTLAKLKDESRKKRGRNGGLLADIKKTYGKIMFATTEQEDLAKLTDQLKVHTGCLQLFLIALNSQSNQRIEADIRILRDFAESFGAFLESSRYRRPQPEPTPPTDRRDSLSPQARWLLESSSGNEAMMGVISQFFKPRDVGPGHPQGTQTSNEHVNQLTVTAVCTEPVTYMDAPFSDPLKDLSISKISKTSQPVFGVFIEFPDTNTPSSLLCPQATVADEWIHIVTNGSWNMACAKLFTCRCSTNWHEASIAEYRAIFNSFCTRRLTFYRDKSIEWTLEGLQRGNKSTTLRISGKFSNTECLWIEEHVVLPVVIQYSRYLYSIQASNLRATPTEDELEYAAYMGYCYSPLEKAVASDSPHKLSQSLSFAPLISVITTQITHPLKDTVKTPIRIVDISYCYIQLYKVVSVDYTDDRSSLSYPALLQDSVLTDTAEITVLCGEETKSHHNLEMVLARFSEDTEFRASPTSPPFLEFRSKKGRVNYIAGDSEFSEVVRFSFFSKKALNAFLAVLKEFQWRLLLNGLKCGKLHEQLSFEFTPSAISFMDFRLSNPHLRIFITPPVNSSGKGFKMRLFAESVDGQSCFSMPIDPGKIEAPQDSPCRIIEDVNDRTAGVRLIDASFSQIRFEKMSDKEHLLKSVEDTIKWCFLPDTSTLI